MGAARHGKTAGNQSIPHLALSQIDGNDSSDDEFMAPAISTKEEATGTEPPVILRQLLPPVPDVHVCNQIMTCKRTSMGNDLLEWMAVLRMNYDWIEERRSVFEEILTKLDLGATEGFTVLA